MRHGEINTSIVSPWESLNLSSTVLESIARLQFESPTPIQLRAIPLIQDGHDVIGKASTGSGKTLAFGIPICEFVLANNQLQHQKPRKTTALILSPTRELAHQLSKHLTGLSLPEVAIATITGGLSSQKQKRQLNTANIIIATPGRLWEMMSGNDQLRRDLRMIKFLVLDEADRLLSEGHFREVQEILSALDREEIGDESEIVRTNLSPGRNRQTLIFSATFQRELQQKLNGRSRTSELTGRRDSMEYLLRRVRFREERPHFVDVDPVSQMAANLQEFIVDCAGSEKVGMGRSFIYQDANIIRICIFTPPYYCGKTKELWYLPIASPPCGGYNRFWRILVSKHSEFTVRCHKRLVFGR